MKTTVLKASKDLAERISADLLSILSKNGNPIFKRMETELGFEIVGKRRNDLGEVVIDVIFRFSNNPAPRIDYNEKIVIL